MSIPNLDPIMTRHTVEIAGKIWSVTDFRTGFEGFSSDVSYPKQICFLLITVVMLVIFTKQNTVTVG